MTSVGHDPGDDGDQDTEPFSSTLTVSPQIGQGGERRRGVLTVSEGLEAGRPFLLDEPEGATLGRSPDCTVFVRDRALSRLHARVLKLGGMYVLRDEGSRNGTFVNGSRVSTAELRDGDRLALGGGVTLRFSLLTEAEINALEQTYDAAVRDGLTGVFNRQHLERRLDQEIDDAARDGTQLSLVLFDVDHFKKVNDTFGHPAGDAVLGAVGRLLRQSSRATDTVGRYGGEEFAIIVPRTDPVSASVLADRVRARLGESPIEAGGASITVTASAGVASLDCCGEARGRGKLVAIADERLYRAKAEGRNRVVGPL